MTVTEKEHERDMLKPMSSAEREKYKLQGQKVAQDALLYIQNPAEFARLQAVGIAENLEKFFSGERDTFTRYFATSNDHHNLIFEKFWTEVCLKFDNIEVIDHPDESRLKEFIFADHGYGLVERMDYDSEGNVFGINYEGYELSNQPVGMIGKIATGLAMG